MGRGLGGGALTVISYSIAIWAMAVAPIAIIAAPHETSVLFDVLIAVVKHVTQLGTRSDSEPEGILPR